jgi:hypothetical protein
MNKPFEFFTELFHRPSHEVIWVIYMMVINLAGAFFWEELLAKVIVIVFMISSMLMMGLYAKFGFTRILGLGHILWIPLVIYIGYEIPASEGIYMIYLIILQITISISVIIDAFVVWKYLRGDTEFV